MKMSIRYLSIFYVLMVFTCTISIGLTSCEAEVYGSPQVSGRWQMIANNDFRFILEISQQGNQITGTMTRTNGTEPVDRVSGRVHDDGTIKFTRYREGSWKQNYQGRISQRGGIRVMEGNFNQDGGGNYNWSARQGDASQVMERAVQVSGQWKMIANKDYHFILDINQRGNQIAGTMTRTNGAEPVDRVTGRVHDDGTIKFTRNREGSWKQYYQGIVNRHGMSGTFTQDSDPNTYSWSAKR